MTSLAGEPADILNKENKQKTSETSILLEAHQNELVSKDYEADPIIMASTEHVMQAVIEEHREKLAVSRHQEEVRKQAELDARSHQVMAVPAVNTSFKSYMDYRAITNKTSPQWKLQKKAYTNSQGLRMIGSDYLVALGTHYSSKCGERFRITLSSGTVFTVTTGDIKSDSHTNSTKQYVEMSGNRGNMIEFIVDQGALNSQARSAGDVSCLGLNGKVVKIEKILS